MRPGCPGCGQRLWAGWAAGPARASRSCLESGQLKPDTWLLVPRVAAQEGGMEAWARSSGLAQGRLRALFVLAAASKSEELLIVSRGPPSLWRDRVCSSLAGVRWVGTHTHAHIHIPFIH